ncbi:hypothetical protein, partial [Veronia nyctiphanis]|uniref:hypothetical protein n=1 Tax=Veronia nyctiphanis TaxID=1278244 RepID=UPI001F456141
VGYWKLRAFTGLSSELGAVKVGNVIYNRPFSTRQRPIFSLSLDKMGDSWCRILEVAGLYGVVF